MNWASMLPFQVKMSDSFKSISDFTLLNKHNIIFFLLKWWVSILKRHFKKYLNLNVT